MLLTITTTSQWENTTTKTNRDATRPEMQLVRLVYESSGTHYKWVRMEQQEVIQQITVTVFIHVEGVTTCDILDLLSSFCSFSPKQTWPGPGLLSLFSGLIEISLGPLPPPPPSVSSSLVQIDFVVKDAEVPAVRGLWLEKGWSPLAKCVKTQWPDHQPACWTG